MQLVYRFGLIAVVALGVSAGCTRARPLAERARCAPGAREADVHACGLLDSSSPDFHGKLLRSRKVEIIQPFLTPSTFYGLIPALAMRTPIKIVTERCGVRKVRGAGYKTYRTVEDLSLIHISEPTRTY